MVTAGLLNADDSLYNAQNLNLVHHLNAALRASASPASVEAPPLLIFPSSQSIALEARAAIAAGLVLDACGDFRAPRLAVAIIDAATKRPVANAALRRAAVAVR